MRRCALKTSVRAVKNLWIQTDTMQLRAKDTTVFLAAMIRYAISSNDGALLHNLHRRRNLSFLRNNEIFKPKLYILQKPAVTFCFCVLALARLLSTLPNLAAPT